MLLFKYNWMLASLARLHWQTSRILKSDTMPNYAAKVSSAYLAKELMLQFIAALPSVMRDIYGNGNLTARYGWGCKLHPDLWYKPMGVPLEVFPYFVEDSIEQRIFVVGGSDLSIESPDAQLRILLCHEADVHLDGTDDEAIERFIANFPQLDFRTADEWKAEFNSASDARVD